MKLLFVHERFGALAGAEANILATARELKQRGHTVGVLHGPGTGKGEQLWRETFTHAFPLPPTDKAIGVLDVIDQGDGISLRLPHRLRVQLWANALNDDPSYCRHRTIDFGSIL